MKTLLLTAALACAPMAAHAQAVFRAGVELVEVDVSVTRGGRPVSGLTAADFVLTDNGMRQEVESLVLSQLPLDVTLLLDTSDSVSGDRLEKLVEAGLALTRALRPGDRAALMTFSHEVRLRVPMTAEMDLVRDGLSAISGSGMTAVRDGLHLALHLPRGGERRPLVLLFTDGNDTASWLTDEEALASVRQAGTVVHVVRAGVEDARLVQRIAQAAGGRVWSARSDRQIRQLFSDALEEMRARYLLAYTPTGVEVAEWHDIRVRLRDGRASVTARPGYFAGLADER